MTCISKLAELQAQFINDMYGNDNRSLSAFDETYPLAPEKQLNIYQQSMFGGLTDALQQIFPITLQLCGEQCFNQLAHHYIKTHPQISPDLNQYGAAFPCWVGETPPGLSLPYLKEVLQFEWGVHQALNAPRTKVVDLISLQDAVACPITWAPSLSLIQSAYPLLSIWHAHQQDEIPEIQIDGGGGMWVIWLKGINLHILPISSSWWTWLNTFKKPITFESAMAALEKEALDASLQSFLVESVQRQLFSYFSK